jgi:hypothetical protein
MALGPDPNNVRLGRDLKRARKAAGYSNAHKFLAAVKAEQGSAPSYSSYAQWESGEVGPRDGSLDPVQKFHEAHKTWTPSEVPDLATALLGLTRELQAWRLERQSMQDHIEELQAMVRSHDLQLRSAPSGAGSGSQAAPDAPQGSAG